MLADLVPAAVQGLVRDVLLAGPAQEGAVAALCEDAGVVVAGDLRAAAGQARSDTILVLPGNLRLAPGWETALREHLAAAPANDAVLFGRVDGLAARLRARPFGVLIGRERLLAASGDARLQALRRALGPRAKRLRP